MYTPSSPAAPSPPPAAHPPAASTSSCGTGPANCNRPCSDPACSRTPEVERRRLRRLPRRHVERPTRIRRPVIDVARTNRVHTPIGHTHRAQVRTRLHRGATRHRRLLPRRRRMPHHHVLDLTRADPRRLPRHPLQDRPIRIRVVPRHRRHTTPRPHRVRRPRIRLQRRTDLQHPKHQHEQQRQHHRRLHQHRTPITPRDHDDVRTSALAPSCSRQTSSGGNDTCVRRSQDLGETLEVRRHRSTPAVDPATDRRFRRAGEAGEVGRAQPELALARTDQLAERRRRASPRQRGGEGRQIHGQRVSQRGEVR